MSPDAHLRDWIGALVANSDLDPLGAGRRIREVVGSRRAWIGLDSQWVIVFFDGTELVFSDDTSLTVDGRGSTTSEVVLGILAATIEASEAIETGLIQVEGAPDDVVRLFAVIELLLDASTRVSELRDLADEFVRSREGLLPAQARPRSGWGDELELLTRLGVGE